MSTKQMLLAIGIIAVCWSGLNADPIRLVDSNCAFFAQQSPLLIAQADDEWGVASQPGKARENISVEYKSPSRAALYSLLLPGLGEVYVGEYPTRAAAFLAAELGIWSTFAFYRKLGEWKEDDYTELAIANAGIDPSGKSEFFYDMIGFYENRDEYNKVSRVYTRTNPFFPENPSWDWQWKSEDDRANYRDVKNGSKTAFRNANFALGVAALNRAVSMVFAWRSAKGHNRGIADEFSGFDLEFRPDLSGNSIQVRLEYTAKF